MEVYGLVSKKYGKYVRGGAPATKKFDMNKPVIKANAFLLPFAWAYCYIRRAHHLEKVEKNINYRYYHRGIHRYNGKALVRLVRKQKYHSKNTVFNIIWKMI